MEGWGSLKLRTVGLNGSRVPKNSWRLFFKSKTRFSLYSAFALQASGFCWVFFACVLVLFSQRFPPQPTHPQNPCTSLPCFGRSLWVHVRPGGPPDAQGGHPHPHGRGISLDRPTLESFIVRFALSEAAPGPAAGMTGKRLLDFIIDKVRNHDHAHPPDRRRFPPLWRMVFQRLPREFAGLSLRGEGKGILFKNWPPVTDISFTPHAVNHVFPNLPHPVLLCAILIALLSILPHTQLLLPKSPNTATSGQLMGVRLCTAPIP